MQVFTCFLSLIKIGCTLPASGMQKRVYDRKSQQQVIFKEFKYLKNLEVSLGENVRVIILMIVFICASCYKNVTQLVKTFE